MWSGAGLPFPDRGAPGCLASGGRAALSNQLTVTPQMEVTPQNLQDNPIFEQPSPNGPGVGLPLLRNLSSPPTHLLW